MNKDIDMANVNELPTNIHEEFLMLTGNSNIAITTTHIHDSHEEDIRNAACAFRRPSFSNGRRTKHT